MIRTWELNFVLLSNMFIHYDGQLRVSHVIFGFVPSYTNYQDTLGALTIDSPLLSYLDVWLPRFLLSRLTSDEARYQGPRRVRQGSLELVRDGSADTVFQGQDVHILVKAPNLEPLL